MRLDPTGSCGTRAFPRKIQPALHTSLSLSACHRYYHLGETCALLAQYAAALPAALAWLMWRAFVYGDGRYDDAVSYLSAAVAQAEVDGHEVATARSKLYGISYNNWRLRRAGFNSPAGIPLLSIITTF